MGLDRLGVGAHQAQFGAHAFDVAVDAPLVAGVGGHAQGVEQLLTAEDPLGLFEQTLQQAEFVTGQAQGLATVDDLHPIGIDAKQRRRTFDRRARRHAFKDGAAPERQLHAG